MPIAEAIQEMEGKISLLDNKTFIIGASFTGLYYMLYLGWLIHVISQTH